MPKPKLAEIDAPVAIGDRDKYDAATPEQRAKYDAAVVELRETISTAVASGVSDKTPDDAVKEARERLRQKGIISADG